MELPKAFLYIFKFQTPFRLVCEDRQSEPVEAAGTDLDRWARQDPGGDREGWGHGESRDAKSRVRKHLQHIKLILRVHWTLTFFGHLISFIVFTLFFYVDNSNAEHQPGGHFVQRLDFTLACDWVSLRELGLVWILSCLAVIKTY